MPESFAISVDVNAFSPNADFVPSDFSSIRRWFSGKALTILDSYVLPTVAQAERDGAWPKGASRKVCAALNKQNVAAKFAKSQSRDRGGPNGERNYYVLNQGGYEGLLCDIVEDRTNPYCGAGGRLVSAMQFGSFSRADELLAVCDTCRTLTQNDSELNVLLIARGWCEDFAPVARLCRLLDSRRPLRTVVFGTLSPLVVASLGEHLKLDLSTVRSPEMISEWRQDPEDPCRQILVFTIIWPEGTKHGKSKFADGTWRNHQCHACGHAIKNVFNWVPLLIDSKAGAAESLAVPHSFWVGRDCAKNLFGADVQGDALYEGRE